MEQMAALREEGIYMLEKIDFRLSLKSTIKEKGVKAQFIRMGAGRVNST